MPLTYSNIHPIPVFATEAEELEYASKEAEAYFKEDVYATYCLWKNDNKDKFLFIAEISGGVYAVYKLGKKIR